MVFLGRGGGATEISKLCVSYMYRMCSYVLPVSDIHYDTDKVASYCEVVGLNY